MVGNSFLTKYEKKQIVFASISGVQQQMLKEEPELQNAVNTMVTKSWVSNDSKSAREFISIVQNLFAKFEEKARQDALALRGVNDTEINTYYMKYIGNVVKKIERENKEVDIYRSLAEKMLG